ncbi:MAG TPA: glycerol kinase GlpK [Polyangiaceae bacterium]|jgi:glycerol kinase|nr:MAG: Glycerol kinase [Deltaproteobacteria bacterium ADurb.Bin207]HNS95591.1 glycerol kinase GlpK [Polyangiaceae bacterium]HNZ21255.1 glycerol kinase GlpK [Polyangiaceae bacterium]HOD21059.1 glycerol kinase GlpK [Polyangiaceae bacterium]HOE48643.1 glycerol kinase GlpK [Polyangiaceae bacterium]
MPHFILAIDQGTTGSTALVMDTDGKTLGRANVEFPQHYPQPGWVEHEPDDIWNSVVSAIGKALDQASILGHQIEAIGITNQRETTVVWNRSNGMPIHRAIVWQCRRTAQRCATLKQQGNQDRVRQQTGLVIDPYFSGTKITWLLDEVAGARKQADQGQLAFGTIDSYLTYRLTGGRVHVTDVSNASRTLLMNLHDLRWDESMCELFDVPPSVLPTIVGSAERVGETHGVPGLPDGIPITGMAGDQHAALFGQQCLDVGDVKCTYGTGAFVLVNTGNRPVPSRFGLLTTVGWKIGADIVYALEGSAFIAGAAVQWLRDGLGLIRSASEIESLARKVPSSDGVVLVPALAGLGAPYWNADARGLITGITRGTTAAHLAYATLEGIAHEVSDLLEAMRDDMGKPMGRIRVDGAAAANDLLMQMQADLAGIIVERPKELETTARGAAMLAAIGLGVIDSPKKASGMFMVNRVFQVEQTKEQRDKRRNAWSQAVRRAQTT